MNNPRIFSDPRVRDLLDQYVGADFQPAERQVELAHELCHKLVYDLGYEPADAKAAFQRWTDEKKASAS